MSLFDTRNVFLHAPASQYCSLSIDQQGPIRRTMPHFNVITYRKHATSPPFYSLTIRRGTQFSCHLLQFGKAFFALVYTHNIILSYVTVRW